MKRFLTLALLVALTGTLSVAEGQGTPKGTKKKAAGPSVAQQLTELKQAIDAQQQQILTLGQQLQSRDQRIQQLEQRLDQSQAAVTQVQAKEDSAASETADDRKTVATLSDDVKDLKANSANIVLTLQDTQKSLGDKME